MKSFKLVLLIVCCFHYYTGFSQDLTSHKWENRLVLILTNDPNDLSFKKQLLEFQKNPVGFKERKLLVYLITPNKFKKGLYGDTWQTAKTKFESLNTTHTNFEVILIGLDGGIKLRQSTLLGSDKLFSVIDRMPMRRQELREN